MKDDDMEMQPGLYVDEADGIIKNSYIERIFDDFYYEKITSITTANLHEYAKAWIDKDIPRPTRSVLTNATRAMEWAFHFGFVTIWELEKDDFTEYDIDPTQGFKYAAKIGKLDHGNFATGRTIPQAVMLATIQVLREMSEDMHNMDDDSETVH